jgi:uncharacterized protein YggE
MTKLRYVLLISGVLLVAAAIAGVAQPSKGGAANPSTTTVTVSGNGTANATPDKASFNFGVTTNAATASAALSKNSDQANAIIDALKSSGVDSSDIQTSQVSLWPQTSNDGTTITGYQASNTVTVTAPVAKSGDLVDAAVSHGANNVDGPNLSVSDTTAAYAAAMKDAVADAQSKAQAIASAAGLTLGGIVHISDDGSSTPGPIPYAMEAAKAGPPIEAGTQQIDASVTVTYSASN